jgi:small-conductance mechanosensitive channel
MGGLGFILPLLLVVGGTKSLWWLSSPLKIQNSLSAYYHAGSMCMASDGVYQNLFVGILVAISSCLIIYKGFGNLEDCLLNFAGLSLACVAFFPMNWPEPQVMSICQALPGFMVFNSSKLLGLPISLHTISALVFFLAITLVNVLTAMDTVHLIEDKEKKKFWSNIFSYARFLMPIALVVVLLLWFITGMNDRLVLLLEWAGIWAFSLYWVLKSLEILQTKVDKDMINGKIYRNRRNLTRRDLSK